MKVVKNALLHGSDSQMQNFDEQISQTSRNHSDDHSDILFHLTIVEAYEQCKTVEGVEKMEELVLQNQEHLEKNENFELAQKVL